MDAHPRYTVAEFESNLLTTQPWFLHLAYCRTCSAIKVHQNNLYIITFSPNVLRINSPVTLPPADSSSHNTLSEESTSHRKEKS